MIKSNRKLYKIKSMQKKIQKLLENNYSILKIIKSTEKMKKT